MKTAVRERYQVMFMIFIALGVYYPSIFGQANSVDDFKMITNLFNARHVDLKGLFFPTNPHSYYRPLLLLSFYLDRFVFFCSESFMHLINIILHTINGVLVFFIVREMIRLFKISANHYAPMFTSLLFILHPINTEPVNWISGRTDILAGSFVFLAFFVFLRKGLKNYIWCWTSAIFYFMGLLSKEVALGLLPVIGLFLILKEQPIKELLPNKRLMHFLPFLLFTLFYFLMRSVASGSLHGMFVTVPKATESGNLQIGIDNAVKAIGFYIKKLIIPIPLNFGIIEIYGSFYFWVGIITGVFALFLFIKKRTLLIFIFLSAILFFLPALAVAMRIIEAWTPVGERYLYISSFGASTLTIFLSEKVPWRKELTYGFLGILLVTAAIITTQRNIVWQNNLTLFEDTIKKSPSFAAARNEYAIALVNIGRIDEAAEQFSISAKLADNIKYRELPSLNAIELKTIRERHPEEVKKEYLKLIETNPEASTEIRRKFIRFLNYQTLEEKDKTKLQALYREIIFHTEKLFKVEKNGFNAYRLGQLYLALGERKEAVEYFRKAVELSPNEYFSDPARKLISRLNAKN